MGDLVQVLERAQGGQLVAPAAREDILVSTDFADDAAVVRLAGDGERALVLTADVIAPLVDDPEDFGRIAATNAISDVYAMGGRPLYALNLVFFPDEQLDLAVLEGILRGGAAACAEAGVAIVGGHTVRDQELKYGLSVTGEVAVSEVLSNRGARAGQRLVLSKALGTGVIGQAIKAGAAAAEEASAAIASMTRSNRSALAVARRHRVSAATDVTGFGLLGHLRNILRGSDLTARVELAALPLLPGALEHARAGRLPGGTCANLKFLAAQIERAPGVEEGDLRLTLACDAQTSGGLLLTVDPADAPELVRDLRADGLPASDIGGLVALGPGRPAGAIEIA